MSELIAFLPAARTHKRRECCILAPPNNFPSVGGGKSRAAGLVRLMAELSERLLIENLPLLEQIVQSICTRKGMDADEIEEFAADVKLRLVNHDYAVIKAYAGRSSFKTYLTAVVSRLLLDYRNQQWGKWRDSANAQHLGPLAVTLERMLYRDGKPFDEACTLLVGKDPSLTRQELTRLAEQLRPRTGRRTVNLDEAATIATPLSGVDFEGTETASRISAVVRQYLDELAAEDQVIFQLRFDADLTVREIATSLHADPQKVFRRLYRHYEALRNRLEKAGIDAADVERLIGNDTALLDFHLKNRGLRPSEEDESAVEVRQKDVSS